MLKSKKSKKGLSKQSTKSIMSFLDEEPRISLLAEIINLTSFCVTGVKERISDDNIFQNSKQKIVDVKPSWQATETDYTIIQIFN